MTKQRSRFSVQAGSLILVAACACAAHANTIVFTFSVTADASISAAPTQLAPTVPTTITGPGSFAPFGNAIYSEAGTITYTQIQPGIFVPAVALNDFTVSFNAGDSITGTDSVAFGPLNAMGLPTFSNTLTITGGTGVFSGATGFANALGVAMPSGLPSPTVPTPVSFSGTGQIAAPGLTAAPEPAAMLFLGAGLCGLLALRKSPGRFRYLTIGALSSVDHNWRSKRPHYFDTHSA